MTEIYLLYDVIFESCLIEQMVAELQRMTGKTERQDRRTKGIRQFCARPEAGVHNRSLCEQMHVQPEKIKSEFVKSVFIFS